ncbi:hypothetical protein [Pendulispora albinea]|uniref:Uncharacterized protein n=1 Tax=Pendulispora albinea TaxID=2741071 RepID=A0ABZ2M920_9BACT
MLKTTQQGTFSVQATGTDGSPPIVWNVVFVAVQVLRPRSKIHANPGSGYSGSASRLGSGAIQVVSGAAPNHGWASMLDVRLVGGGISFDHRLGIDSVALNMLSNGTGTDVTATYVNDALVTKQSREHLPKVPVVDTDDRDVDDPLQHFPKATNTNAITIERWGNEFVVQFFDSPRTLSFPLKHPGHKDASIRRIDGSMKFRTALAAISKDAPHSVVVYAHIAWEADVSGVVEVKELDDVPGPDGRPLRDENNEKIQLINASWTALATAGTRTEPRFTVLPGGADAKDAGFEIWPPNFMHQVTRHDDP